MELVKLHIDGKRVIADNRMTILEVARENGITSIPTLCHDGRLEPFASCFLCVVKVQGARTLAPACSTRVAAGMVVETVQRGDPALAQGGPGADALQPLRGLHRPLPAGLPGGRRHPGLHRPGRPGQAPRRHRPHQGHATPCPRSAGGCAPAPARSRAAGARLLDEAVGVDYIKRYLSDLDLGDKDPWRPAVAPPNGKKVAVVGAGPAGLSCAYYLALRGYGVSMFEAQPEAGGMLRYGIPEYRLPKDVLDLEISQILDLGVQLSTNVQLGRDFTVASLKQGGYDAIFLGLGAWDSSKMRVQDEDSPGVLAGIDFLKQFGLRRKIDIHGRVLVVGGGNTAIDCARTALRLGVAEVRLLYRRTRKEMPANEMEIVEAEHEGVKMDFLVAPVRVLRGEDGRVAGVECIRMELGEPDQSGRRSPKPDSRLRVPHRLRLRPRRHRPGHARAGAGGRAGAQLPAPGRVAEPHPLADRAGQRAHLRDHRGRRVLGRRRGHGGGHRDRGHRRRAQGRLRHRPLRGHRPGRARAGGGLQPQGRLPQGAGLGPAPGLRRRAAEHARAPPRGARPQLRRGGDRLQPRGPAPGDGALPGVRLHRPLHLRPAALRHRVRGRRPDVHGRGRRAPGRPAPPADRARPQQVHPVRPLRAHLQRAGGRGRLRLRQPRLRHRGQARPGRLPARHRVRELRAVHRHLPHRGHRREAAPGQARPLEDHAAWSRCAPTAARAAGSATRSPARTLVQVSRAAEATRPRRQPLQEGPLRLRPRAVGRAPALAPAARRARAAGDDPRRGPALLRHAAQGADPPLQRRPDGGLRLPPPDQRGDLPRPEAGPAGPAHAQRDLAAPSLVNRELAGRRT